MRKAVTITSAGKYNVYRIGNMRCLGSEHLQLLSAFTKPVSVCLQSEMNAQI